MEAQALILKTQTRLTLDLSVIGLLGTTFRL